MRHIKIFEQFDDYDLEDIFGKENEFKPGDKVCCENGFYWCDYGLSWNSNYHFREKTSIKNKGSWNVSKGNWGTIESIDQCNDVDGYTGQIIQLEEPYWPWFQTTNFKKTSFEI